MKHIATYIIIISISVFFTACKDANPLDCTKNTGPIIKESRAFDTIVRMIVLEDNVNLVIDNVYTKDKVEIEAGKNLMSKIITEVKHDTLFIQNKNSCNWIRDYKKEVTAHVSLNHLNQIEYRGSGDISCISTITNESFILDVWEGAGNVNLKLDVDVNQTYLHIGTADVKISGKADNNHLSSESYGLLDTRHLLAINTYVNSKSPNHTYVYASSTLEATIQSIGNIYYAGQPNNITPSILGNGQLISLDR